MSATQDRQPGQTLANLYGAVRLYVNYFQPSFQLLTKSRNAGSVAKRYSKPATPCDRLLVRDDEGWWICSEG